MADDVAAGEFCATYHDGTAPFDGCPSDGVRGRGASETMHATLSDDGCTYEGDTRTVARARQANRPFVDLNHRTGLDEAIKRSPTGRATTPQPASTVRGSINVPVHRLTL